jgi:hypothetical protein
MTPVFESLIGTITPWFREWGLMIVFVATFLESSVVVASVLLGESVSPRGKAHPTGGR